MEIGEIYSTYFPNINGVDDNNYYGEFLGTSINRVQLVEPTLEIKDFIYTIKERYDTSNPEYKYAYRIPLITIDEYLIRQIDITDFRLEYNDFLPSLNFDFVDSENRLLTINPPRAGSIISVYIGGNGDELYYKPIRQDFILTSIRKIDGGNQGRGDIIKYRVYGKYNIPYGYKKESWDAGTCTAMQALFNVGVWCGLGFATNFTKTNTCDEMYWLNDNTKSLVEFMEDIAGHACYSPNTFFTSFVDQYNVLNFVECHSLLSHGGSKEDVPAMIYRSYPAVMVSDPFDRIEKTPYNQLPIKPWDTEKEENSPHYLDNSYQKLSSYYISNNDKYNGWTNYIKGYYEINNFVSDGCKTTVEFNNERFVIRPIDNLKRDSSKYEIQDLPSKPTVDSYIPTNLIQTSNKDYVNEHSSSYRDNPTTMESFNNFGEVAGDNIFPMYYFAEVQNKYQMNMMKKSGLHVTLQNYNPAITKFSRIWVDIYDKNIDSKLKEKKIYKSDKGNGDDSSLSYEKYKKEYNDNLLTFEGEDDPELELKDKDYYGTYNRGLSGWYVVTSMEIRYDPDDNNLNMELVLNRIEKKPMFKSEYTMAVEGVKKYKNENILFN